MKTNFLVHVSTISPTFPLLILLGPQTPCYHLQFSLDFHALSSAPILPLGGTWLRQRVSWFVHK